MKSPEFARHEALLEQTWRTMKDSIILKVEKGATYERPEGSSFYERRPGNETPMEFMLRVKARTHGPADTSRLPDTPAWNKTKETVRAANDAAASDAAPEIGPGSTAASGNVGVQHGPQPQPSPAEDESLATHIKDMHEGQETPAESGSVSSEDTKRKHWSEKAADWAAGTMADKQSPLGEAHDPTKTRMENLAAAKPMRTAAAEATGAAKSMWSSLPTWGDLGLNIAPAGGFKFPGANTDA